MPYSSNSDLPEAVRSRYSDHCQSVFRNVWNDTHSRGADESSSFAQAHAAAKKCEGSKAMADRDFTGKMEPPQFKIFAPMLKATRSGDGRMRLHGVASSTIKDRHGDQISLAALSDMERSANQNMTIFLNHEYRVPEDVAGTVEHAAIRRHPTDPDIHDLALDILVNEANPRAVSAWEAIQNGTQLGLSIGARVPDGGATRDRKTGTYMVDRLELLETSLVGVPANPRTWVEYAVKSLNAMRKELDDEDLEHTEDPVEDDEDAEDTEEPEVVEKAAMSSEHRSSLPDSAFACPGKRKYPHHTASGAVDKAHLRNALSRCGDESNDQCGCSHIRAHAKSLGIGGDSEKSMDELLVLALGDDFDEAHFHLEAEEGPTFEWDWHAEDMVDLATTTTSNLTSATVNIKTPYANVSIDTGNRGPKATEDGTSQEALTSAPENEDEDEAEKPKNPWAAIGLSGEPEEDDIRAALQVLEPTVVASMRTSAELLKAVTRELIDTQKALREALDERDAAMAATEKVVSGTAQILTRLSNTPVGRRSVVRQAHDEFASLSAVYGEEFLTLLKKG